jgi:vancomycin resistance protein YoaR
MKRQWKNTFLAVGILGIFIVMGVLLYIYHVTEQFNAYFAKNIFVDGIAIGGLTLEEGVQKIKDYMTAQQAEGILYLSDDEQEVEIPFDQFPVQTNLEQVLQQAYELGHTEGLLKKYQIAKKGITSPEKFSLTYSYHLEDIENVLMNYKESFYREPANAVLIRENRKFVLTPEKIGKALDISQTAQKILDVLTVHEDIKVEAVINYIEPQFKAADLQQAQTPIASFYTTYNDLDLGRNQNLEVAASKINKMLMPGEKFSLATQLEPITFEEGYRDSKVIVNGRLEEGIGGGVCQIASTLYNAVLLSDLDIVTRRNHSLPVAYVPLGRDATYATGGIDFQFQNNSNYPVFIESYCENNRVYVNLFGEKSLKPPYDEIKFYSELIETIEPPATTYVDDPTLEKGKTVQDLTPLEGKKVKLYKLYYNNGELVNKILIDTSYYKARGEVIKVGTKETSPTANENITSAETVVQTPVKEENNLENSHSETETQSVRE